MCCLQHRGGHDRPTPFNDWMCTQVRIASQAELATSYTHSISSRARQMYLLRLSKVHTPCSIWACSDEMQQMHSADMLKTISAGMSCGIYL